MRCCWWLSPVFFSDLRFIFVYFSFLSGNFSSIPVSSSPNIVADIQAMISSTAMKREFPILRGKQLQLIIHQQISSPQSLTACPSTLFYPFSDQRAVNEPSVAARGRERSPPHCSGENPNCLFLFFCLIVYEGFLRRNPSEQRTGIVFLLFHSKLSWRFPKTTRDLEVVPLIYNDQELHTKKRGGVGGRRWGRRRMPSAQRKKWRIKKTARVKKEKRSTECNEKRPVIVQWS